MQPDGTLKWIAPAGAWTVYRLGYGPTGATCNPIPKSLNALECDKLSAEAVRFHLQQVINPLKEHLGADFGKSFRQITFDSNESGRLNWTEQFREEFKNRRGYDPVIWLPTLDKRVIGSEDQTHRFAWDMKTTVEELFTQNFWAQARTMINEARLQMVAEPYGRPINSISACATPNVSMGEFWNTGNGEIGRDIIGSAQAAGIRIIGAESFTAMPVDCMFTETPATLKASGDGCWVSGVNLIFLHSWTHQPFSKKIKPGMSTNWWGCHFGRNQTWFGPGKAWFAYMARSQSLLQRGEPVSDYLAINQNTRSDANRGDVIAFENFLAQATVKDGLIVLPSTEARRVGASGGRGGGETP